MAVTVGGRRLTEAHRVAQAKVGALTVLQMHTIFPLLDVRDLDATFPRWLKAAAAVVGAQRVTSARLAANYVTTFRALELGPDVAPVVPSLSETVVTQRLATSLLVTGPVSLKANVGRAMPLERATSIADANSARAAMRHVLDGGRDTILETVKADPRATRWQRVTSEKPCDFCDMLAGRGAVYKADTVDFLSHDGCACGAEPGY